MKTLVVSYLPSQETSNTKILLDAFLAETKNTNIEHLDLILNPPSFFMPDSLSAYRMRNYGGMELNELQQKSIEAIDKMCKQFAEADTIIIAYPMHNYGMPGIIKTYFDAVMQHGKTFQYGAHGPEGLMKGKKALTIYTSGGGYSSEKVAADYPNWDTLTVLSKIEFTFMGFSEIEIVGAQGTLNPAEGAKEKSLNNAIDKLKTIAHNWYK
jgi:FMN-dependent NADH-azoreductase